MSSFDLAKKWTIIAPNEAKKAAEDLSRCIGRLAGEENLPAVIKPSDSPPTGAIIVLNSSESSSGRNTFRWRARNERVEIFGDSIRGLCNGIYSFLAALGIGWPAPGLENFPEASSLSEFPIEPSGSNGKSEGALRRFVAAKPALVGSMLKNSEAFAAWAARNCYDALIFPLSAFASGSTKNKLMQLKQFVLEYGITLEAGGWDLSSLVPRRYFFFRRDSFRMVEGSRKIDHHFCPTSLGAIGIMGKEGKKLLQAAEGVEVIHLWPDKDAETAWCSCPTCRAFTVSEQNRIAVNAAADILATINPNATIVCLENPGETGNIALRKNVTRLESLPSAKIP